MIYITGDTHGDLSRFKTPALKKIKKRDTLIICGDFGFIWDSSKKEKRILKKIGKRKYNVLFVDGAHENFDELQKYEVEEFRGGKVRRISGNLRYLMRGQVFEIEGKKIFAFGGGDFEENNLLDLPEDLDKLDFSETTSEVSEASKFLERPERATEADFKEAIKNLERINFEADYIVSYEPPTKIAEFLTLNQSLGATLTESDKANYYLDKIDEKTNYKRWFFGKLHINKIVASKYYALFDNVVNADTIIK